MFSASRIAVLSSNTRMRNKLCFLAAAALLLTLLVALFPATKVLADSPPTTEADILIKGGRVIDGSGGPWMQADVAIKGDQIIYVGRAPVKARRIINAAGKAR